MFARDDVFGWPIRAAVARPLPICAAAGFGSVDGQRIPIPARGAGGRTVVMTDPAITFYQALAGISFTLLGLWFAVLQFGHGGWRSDAERHRSGLHIALHFFLPGMASLASMLGVGTGGGVMWRIVFAIAGLVGLFESLSFLRAADGPTALVGQTLRAMDPGLYMLMIAAAFVRPGTFTLTPLQIEGMVTGTLFVLGLCYVWLAFAEREVPAEPAPVGGE